MRARIVAMALLLCCAFAQPSGAADIAASPLLLRMERLNADVKSYTAELHVDVAMRSFPFLNPSLDGDVYYEAPDKTAVVFHTVPILAEQFKKVYPKVDPPGKWLDLYDVSVVNDTKGVTTFRLVPHGAARVDHLDVQADDKNATILSMTWTYRDGGSVSLTQQFTPVEGHLLVSGQSGQIALPGYQAAVTTAFSGYKLNVPVDGSVFTP